MDIIRLGKRCIDHRFFDLPIQCAILFHKVFIQLFLIHFTLILCKQLLVTLFYLYASDLLIRQLRKSIFCPDLYLRIRTITDNVLRLFLVVKCRKLEHNAFDKKCRCCNQDQIDQYSQKDQRLFFLLHTCSPFFLLG